MASQSFFAFLFLSCVWIGYHGSFGQSWDYGELGPDVWPDLFSTCGGYEQSPINIEVRKTKYKKYPAFRLSKEYFKTKVFKLVNGGSGGISASLVDQSSPFLSFSGGGLEGTYKFMNLHFHWGPNYASSSDHRIDGEKTTAELHLVHQNTVTGAYAALGFLIETVREKDIEDGYVCPWQSYFEVGATLQQINQSEHVLMNLGSIIKDNLDTFWRYEGSLTVPPCTEGITWTVFTKTLLIRDRNIDLFRKNIMPLNYREPQPLYGRRVYRNYYLSKSQDYY